MSVIDNKTRLQHMLEACRKVIAFTEDENRETLAQDEMLQLSLVRLIEIVGEAASRITEDFRHEHPSIPWAAIVGMRNRLVHAYFEIDLDVVWDTVTDAIPELIEQIEAALDEEFGEADSKPS